MTRPPSFFQLLAASEAGLQLGRAIAGQLQATLHDGDRVPRAGAALLVGNHALLGLDSVALSALLIAETGRTPRFLAERNLFRLPLAKYALEAVGAIRTFPTPPYPSTHNLGTNRMSERPEDGVVNKWGQTHDVKNLFVSDGSQFTTGAAENPTLTIVSLALRQADYIADQMGKNEI